MGVVNTMAVVNTISSRFKRNLKVQEVPKGSRDTLRYKRNLKAQVGSKGPRGT